MQRLAIALLVSGLGLAAVPSHARAQDSRIGSIWLPSGARYPTDSRAPYPTNGRVGKQKGNSGKRDYIDGSGCKVKEQNKPNGDYKYERSCKHADKNIAKAQKEAAKRNRDIYGQYPGRNDRYPSRNDGGIWLPSRNNQFGLLQRLGIGLP